MGTAKQSIDEHCEPFFEEKIIDLRALALQKTSNVAKEMKKTNIEQMCERPILFCILGCFNNQYDFALTDFSAVFFQLCHGTDKLSSRAIN